MRGVGKGDLIGLLRHRTADFGDAVADANDSSLTGGVEIASTVIGDDPTAFTANSDRIILTKIA